MLVRKARVAWSKTVSMSESFHAGTLPLSLADTSNLQFVDISSNKLTGTGLVPCAHNGPLTPFNKDDLYSFVNGMMSRREACRLMLQALCPPAMLTWMGFRSWMSLTMPLLGE